MTKLSNTMRLTLANMGIREEPAEFIARCMKKGWVKPAPPPQPDVIPADVSAPKEGASRG